jgi:hypothetical protein
MKIGDHLIGDDLRCETCKTDAHYLVASRPGRLRRVPCISQVRLRNERRIYADDVRERERTRELLARYGSMAEIQARLDALTASQVDLVFRHMEFWSIL